MNRTLKSDSNDCEYHARDSNVSDLDIKDWGFCKSISGLALNLDRNLWWSIITPASFDTILYVLPRLVWSCSPSLSLLYTVHSYLHTFCGFHDRLVSHLSDYDSVRIREKCRRYP